MIDLRVREFSFTIYHGGDRTSHFDVFREDLDTLQEKLLKAYELHRIEESMQDEIQQLIDYASNFLKNNKMCYATYGGFKRNYKEGSILAFIDIEP